MAKLINGNGNLAIYAEEDADWFGSIFGNTTAITGIGNQFAYSLLDANTVGVQDGVIISKEGRRVQLNANEIDEFDIPTGAQGTTSYYIIGYHLITDETSAQTCETFVELMDNGTDTIPEGTFRGGDDDVYISLYRVKQVDLVITQLTLLLPKVSTISEINQHLTANSNSYSASYQNGKYGFMIDNNFYEIGGGGMPILDFDNPLHTFSAGNLSYTATKDCYLLGTIGTGGAATGTAITVKIDNTLVFSITSQTTSYNAEAIVPLTLVPSGSTVVCSASTGRLHIFDVAS